jgi:glucosamine-6-phosphate deaminase
MDLRVLDTAEAVASAAADLVVALVAEHPDAAIAWPTGKTPIPFYDELAARHARGASDLRRVRSFNLDELALPSRDPRTFAAFFEKHLWGRTGIDGSLAEAPSGEAEDLETECSRYERRIEAAGGLDLAILGLGVDGHAAYNMPGPVGLRTHVVVLPDEVAASLAPPAERRPLRAITMGLDTLRSARRILVLATGASKAGAVRALARGPRSEDWPCSFLTDHPALTLLVDHAAVPGAPLRARRPIRC